MPVCLCVSLSHDDLFLKLTILSLSDLQSQTHFTTLTFISLCSAVRECSYCSDLVGERTNGTVEVLPSRDNGHKKGKYVDETFGNVKSAAKKGQKSRSVQDGARKAKIRKAHQ